MLRKILTGLLFSVIAVAGCRKKSVSPKGSMAATVNGVAFPATDCYFTSDWRNFSFTGTSGGALNQPHIYFNLYTFTGSIAATSYPIDGIWVFASYNRDTATFAYASYGVIVIDSPITSQVIKGSFNYTCSDSTKVIGTFTATAH